jgi:hypothetical protein
MHGGKSTAALPKGLLFRRITATVNEKHAEMIKIIRIIFVFIH